MVKIPCAGCPGLLSTFGAIHGWNMRRSHKSPRKSPKPSFLNFKVVQGNQCLKARQHAVLVIQ